jgi:hypothetical protein
VTGFYQGGSFQAKWTLSVVIFAGLVIGALASHVHPLIALSGLLIIVGGLALSRGWGGIAEALAGGYRRWGLPVSVPMLRFMGRVLIGMGVVWTLVGVLASV